MPVRQIRDPGPTNSYRKWIECPNCGRRTRTHLTDDVDARPADEEWNEIYALRADLTHASEDLQDIDCALREAFGPAATAGVGSVYTLPQAVRRELAQVQADLARKDELIAALRESLSAEYTWGIAALELMCDTPDWAKFLAP